MKAPDSPRRGSRTLFRCYSYLRPYALLAAGEKPDAPAVAKLLEHLKNHDLGHTVSRASGVRTSRAKTGCSRAACASRARSRAEV